MERHAKVNPHPTGSQYTVDDTQVVDDVFRLYRKQAPGRSQWGRGSRKGSLTHRVDEETCHDRVPLSRMGLVWVNVFSTAV